MNNDKSAEKLPWYSWIVIGAIFLLGLVLLAPIFARTSEVGSLTLMMNKGKQLIIIVRLYADDHDGKCPHALQELVDTGVLDQPVLDKLLVHPYEKPQKPLDWIYIPDLIVDKTAGNYPVLISPVLQDKSGKFKRQLRNFMGQQPSLFPVIPIRMVAFCDSTVEFMSEPDFQKLLKTHSITLPAQVTTATTGK